MRDDASNNELLLVYIIDFVPPYKFQSIRTFAAMNFVARALSGPELVAMLTTFRVCTRTQLEARVAA